MIVILLIIAVIIYISLRHGYKKSTEKKKLFNRVLNILSFSVHLSDGDNNFVKIYRNKTDIKTLGKLANQTLKQREKRHHYNADHKLDKKVLDSGENFYGQFLIEYQDGKKHESVISKSRIDYKNKHFILTEIADVDELVMAYKQATMSDQMKSSFLANMSHDIRTPLNAIVGFSSLLQDCKDKETLKEYSETISFNNQQMLNLVDQVLEIAQMDSQFIQFNDQWLDMIIYAKELKHMFEHLIVNKNITFDIYSPYQSFLLKTDEARLTQIISNFVSNAFKFTQQGSIQLGLLYKQKKFIAYVADTGCGISEEKQKLMFHRFAKLNLTAKGTGLGMAISRSIVEAKKGYIAVYSKLNEGSIFYCVIPEKAKNIKLNINELKNINHIMQHIEIIHD